jgi:two-component system, NarL family, nitrate/nitrite response regulator NarL
MCTFPRRVACGPAGNSARLKSVVANGKAATKVCILSPHSLVLAEFSRVLTQPRFQVQGKQLESMLGPDLRQLPVPRALVYVVDAQASEPAVAALLANISERYPGSRMIVVAEKFGRSDSHHLLRLGVKGLLTYTEAREQLPRALPQVAEGGFWVPRAMLAEFVDAILSDRPGHRIKTEMSMQLSRREQEVLGALLENMANKEIASKFNISERTVKFHVSNLLSKFGVRRRADLILLSYQHRQDGSQQSLVPTGGGMVLSRPS